MVIPETLDCKNADYSGAFTSRGGIGIFDCLRERLCG
jgi:hypothetical protein